MHLPLSASWITEEDVAAVVAVLRSPLLALGPRLHDFEVAMAERCGVRHAVGVSSGTAGLHLALLAAGIGPGDEVITSPFSFVASANCALYVGATPVFADVDPLTFTIDPDEVAAKITPRTRAIVPVDVFGEPCRFEALQAIADRHGLALVRDACEAIGGGRDGVTIGQGGTAAVFGFYPNKQITTGEGGIVVTDSAEIARVVRSLANQGRDESSSVSNHVRLGYNYRLDEMSAALGLSQLRRLDEILDRRARVAALYAERLHRVAAVTLPHVDPRTTRKSWFVYVIRLAETIDRERLMADLARDGIPTRPYFASIPLQPYYRDRFGFRSGDFPVTEAIARTSLALPFFTQMTEAQVDHVCDRLRVALS